MNPLRVNGELARTKLRRIKTDLGKERSWTDTYWQAENRVRFRVFLNVNGNVTNLEVLVAEND